MIYQLLQAQVVFFLSCLAFIAGFQKGRGRRIWPACTREKGGGNVSKDSNGMHPVYLLFLQILNTCESLAVKWHPIKNVCSKISAQNVFLCFLHFFFFSLFWFCFSKTKSIHMIKGSKKPKHSTSK